MKYEELIAITRNLCCFDTATIVQMVNEPRSAIINQLHRWSKIGKIIPLRQGVYTLGLMYRQTPIQPQSIANFLYRPSYLSGLWALGFYGLIPEAVPMFSCITTRSTKSFQNSLGRFEYKSIKKAFFFGYHDISINDALTTVATPEKALLDYFYHSRGEWTDDRISEMRFQQTDLISLQTLHNFAQRMDKPRLFRAVESWFGFCEKDSREGVEI